MSELYAIGLLALSAALIAVATVAGRSVKGGFANWIVGGAVLLFLVAVSIPAFLWLYNASCDYASDKCV